MKHKILWDHLFSARRPDLWLINHKTCHLVDFNVSVVHRVKIKEREKTNKYLDLARELKIMWYVCVTMIAVIVGTLEMISNNLGKWLEELKTRGITEISLSITMLR